MTTLATTRPRFARVEGDLEVDPEQLPRTGLAIRADLQGRDQVYEDGRLLGTVARVLDVRDYTKAGGVFTYQRVIYRPA